MVLEAVMKLCVTIKFLMKYFFASKVCGNGPKKAKSGFFCNLNKNLVFNFH